MKRALLASLFLISACGAWADGMLTRGVDDGTAGSSWVIPGASADINFVTGQYFGTNAGELVITNATGGCAFNKPGSTPLVVCFPPNTMRITNAGLSIGDLQLNALFWSRDLTNAVWTATNMTVAKNATGADGATNGASTITATAPNATICQTVLAPVTKAYDFSMLLKRVTGTGPVSVQMNITGTCGAGTDKAPQINSSTFSRVQSNNGLNATNVQNITVSIKLGTSGDSVIVDYVQVDLQNINCCAVDPIESDATQGTLAADHITVATNTALWAALAANPGSSFAKTFSGAGDTAVAWFFTGLTRFCGAAGGPPKGAPNVQLNVDSAGAESQALPVAGYAFTDSFSAVPATVRAVCTWSANAQHCVGNGGTVGANTLAYSGNTGVLCIGANCTNTQALYGYLQRLTAFPTELSPSAAQTLSANTNY